MPDLTLIAQLYPISQPNNTSVAAQFTKTKNLCKYCATVWHQVAIQGTKFPDVLKIGFHTTIIYIGFV